MDTAATSLLRSSYRGIDLLPNGGFVRNPMTDESSIGN